MKTPLLILWLVVLAGPFASGQQKRQELRQYVLEQDEVDSLYEFDYSKKDDHSVTLLKYLGRLQAADGRVFKVMTSTWIWGMFRRATNRILVYNHRNQYLGNYYVTTTGELPDIISNNELVFQHNNDGDCYPGISSRISFTKGLPQQIFIRCKRDQGDFYTFSCEE